MDEISADPGLRITEDGRVLIGGAPLTVLRLSAQGAALVAQWFAGVGVGESASQRALARRLLDAGLAHPQPGPRRATDVTIVVPVKDDLAGLERCLKRLSAGGASVSVLVVDDGSTAAAQVRTLVDDHGARLVRRETSGGPGVARNAGLAEVDTELVVFVDADVEGTAEWLQALVGHFDDPAVVAVAPRVRSRPGPGLRDRYEREHSPLDLGASPSIVGPGRAVAYVPTAALVVRRGDVVSIGGFDTELRFGEDVDLIWRLVAAGGIVRYDPSVEVVHAPRESWPSWLAQRFGYGSSAASLSRRHGRKVAPARCSPWSMISWGAAAGGHPLIGVGVAAGSSAALMSKLGDISHPAKHAARLAGAGHLHAGRGLARALTRVWWPLAVVATLACRRLRPAIATAAVVPAAWDWVAGRRPADPVRSVALSIVDDLAYGTGVWAGMIREKTAEPLVPDLVNWPGSRSAADDTTVSDR